MWSRWRVKAAISGPGLCVYVKVALLGVQDVVRRLVAAAGEAEAEHEAGAREAVEPRQPEGGRVRLEPATLAAAGGGGELRVDPRVRRPHRVPEDEAARELKRCLRRHNCFAGEAGTGQNKRKLVFTFGIHKIDTRYVLSVWLWFIICVWDTV